MFYKRNWDLHVFAFQARTYGESVYLVSWNFASGWLFDGRLVSYQHVRKSSWYHQLQVSRLCHVTTHTQNDHAQVLLQPLHFFVCTWSNPALHCMISGDSWNKLSIIIMCIYIYYRDYIVASPQRFVCYAYVHISRTYKARECSVPHYTKRLKATPIAAFHLRVETDVLQTFRLKFV